VLKAPSARTGLFADSLLLHFQGRSAVAVIPAKEAVKELVSVLQAATDGPSFDKLRMRMSLISKETSS